MLSQSCLLSLASLMALAGVALAQTEAEKIPVIIPNDSVPRGQNFSVGFTESGGTEQGAFSSTKICIFAANGTDVGNCTRPAYALYSPDVSVDSNGQWQVTNDTSCVRRPSGSSRAVYTFKYNSASWTPQDYTVVFERLLLFGYNGTTDASDGENICIYQPFGREIVQTNATIRVIDNPARPGQRADLTTSEASFATVAPRPTTGSSRLTASSSPMGVFVMVIFAGLYTAHS